MDSAYGGDDGTLSVDTTELPLYSSLDFMAVVTKDNKQLVLRQTVYVTDGDPPDVVIQ